MPGPYLASPARRPVASCCGKGTNYILRENGFPHVVPPDRSSKANPDILERIRATNACIRPADDVPSLFIDGKKCPTAVDSVRKWKMHRGRPSRTEKAAHFGDVVGYAVWRFFPRRGDAKKLLESEGLPRQQTEGFGELAGGDPVGGFAAGGGPPTV